MALQVLMGLCCSDAISVQPQVASITPSGPPSPRQAPGVSSGAEPPSLVSVPAQAAPAPRTAPAGFEPPAGVATQVYDAEDSNNPFVSQVGELPKFEKPAARDDDEMSITSSQCPSIPEGNFDGANGLSAREQKKQAKAVVKAFVKEMVKGKKMTVMMQNGQIKACQASLTRELDCLKIKVGSGSKNIMLTDIAEMHAGAEAEGIDTPLDELCATLMLATDDCITFRMSDINARDTFIMCMLMFCNEQR